MSFFGTIKNAVVSHAGVKMLQSGSDVLINRHTQIVTFNFPAPLRDHADEYVKQLFLNSMEDLCEEEAALLKLAFYFQAAEQAGAQPVMDLLGDAILKIRNFGGQKIRAAIALQVSGQTGY